MRLLVYVRCSIPISIQFNSSQKKNSLITNTQQSALRIIDSLSTSLPPTQIFPALRHLITQYMSSPAAELRRGAMLSLGVAVEGCSEYITPQMSTIIWPLVEAGLRDTDASVRRASCIAVGCLCEWVEDACIARHSILVPLITDLADDTATQKAACTALDGLLEILDEAAAAAYSSALVPRLLALLNNAPMKTRAVAVGALGSLAHAARGRFLPYFPALMETLLPFLHGGGGGVAATAEGGNANADADAIELRGITMDAMGTFADAVGKAAFSGYFAPLMRTAEEGVGVGVSVGVGAGGVAQGSIGSIGRGGSARLRETSFLFFGVMARVYEDEFVPFLPGVVKVLLESCRQSEQDDEGELCALFFFFLSFLFVGR